ncbi:tRNA lysidine(34) synthetase TilS [Thalassotalea sp. PS06]|uniref:tRNA lysidine(34) synthetase TilS n=1 Tax=Thalassotalea sp. PS06 TaxID=2594005 RepID=UPI00116427C6|nr:tRNA lysidine(34) synthetase TilS [Thalassotalea sp. PS06]QDP01722.1 tRNA lysidine(34) synthetase TilS [Thalassotalea sp. PS06]
MKHSQSSPVFDALLTFLAKPELAQKTLVVAYSGGLDSQVLLHALSMLKSSNKISADIRAIHIHHGLSDNADSWQSFTGEQCAKLDIPYQAIKVDLSVQAGGGIEEKARNARYQAFAENTGVQDIIVTAHHQDDQTETFMLALKRGAGVLGLAAMQTLRDMPGVGLLGRPLLGINREQLQTFAEQHGLEWVEDESNQDTRFDRNFLRQQVLPLLQKRWPSFSASVNKSAALMGQTQQLLEELAQLDLGGTQLHQPIPLETFNQLAEHRQLNALRYRFKQLQLRMPEQKPLLEALQQLRIAAADKNPEIKCADAVLRRYQQKLYITRDYQDIQDWSATIDDLSTLSCNALCIELPDNAGKLALQEVVMNDMIDGENQTQPDVNNQLIVVADSSTITLSCHHQNPVCKPEGRSKSRALKKVLQERSIAPWMRRRLVFIYVDNIFAGVVGHFICEDFTLAANLAHNKRVINIKQE